MKKLGEIEKTQDFLGWNLNYLPPCLSVGKKNSQTRPVDKNQIVYVVVQPFAKGNC